MDFAVRVDHRIKPNEDEKRGKYLNIASEPKNMENESDDNTECNRCTWNNTQRIFKGTGRLWKRWICGDQQNYIIFMMDQNTKKSPGDLRRLSVTRTPVKKHLITLLWKNSPTSIIIKIRKITGRIEQVIMWLIVSS